MADCGSTASAMRARRSTGRWLRSARHVTLLASLALLACGGGRAGETRPSAAPIALPADAGAAPPSTSLAPLPEQRNQIRVRSVTGTVEAVGRDGQVRKLAPGDVLAIDDTVRTSPASSATIAMGTADVVVQPRSRLAIMEVALNVSRVLLSAGRMSAALPVGGAAQLRVQVPRSDATATTAGGRISAITDGKGLLAVASELGTATLAAGGRQVTVGAGQQAEAIGGHAPTPAHPIPPSLFLKVGRPPAAAQREARVVLRGQTRPGAVVSARGTHVSADSRGSFTIVVPLSEGQNVLVVDAEDASGHQAIRRAGTVTVRRHPPKVRHKVTW